MTFWTEEKTNQLIAIKDTHSASRIADILGTTKNAVLGKIHRMGLSNPRNEIKKPKKRKPELKPRPQKTIQGVKLEDVTAKQCKFPHGHIDDGNLSFCGAEIHKGSYCKEHYKTCYIKPDDYKHRDRTLYNF